MKNKVSANYKTWKRPMSISSRAFSQQNDSFANKRFLTFERNLSKTQFSFERPKKTSKANFAFELTLHDFVVDDDGLLFVRVEDQLLSDVRSKVSGLCKGQPHIQTTELWLFNKMVLWWWQRNFFSRLFFVFPVDRIIWQKWVKWWKGLK